MIEFLYYAVVLGIPALLITGIAWAMRGGKDTWPRP